MHLEFSFPTLRFSWIQNMEWSETYSPWIFQKWIYPNLVALTCCLQRASLITDFEKASCWGIFFLIYVVWSGCSAWSSIAGILEVLYVCLRSWDFHNQNQIHSTICYIFSLSRMLSISVSGIVKMLPTWFQHRFIFPLGQLSYDGIVHYLWNRRKVFAFFTINKPTKGHL